MSAVESAADVTTGQARSVRRAKIVFLMRSLAGGGAERQIATLGGALAARGYDVCLVTFYRSSSYQVPPGVRYVSLDKAGRWDIFGFVRRGIRVLRAERPDVLHSYLTGANCLAALLHPFLAGTRLVFGLRGWNMDDETRDWVERLVDWLERPLARRADLLIANAEFLRRIAVAEGYPADRIEVIPNGIDTLSFAPDPDAGRSLRATWGVGANTILIGLVARLAAMKDHATFISALARLPREASDVVAVFVSHAPADRRASLDALAAELGISDRVIWAGDRRDMQAVYSALDVLCLSSAYGEGFPNVVAEAMACEVPCVVTDVGDAAAIVGRTGWVVPPKDPASLARALQEAASLGKPGRRELGRKARARIQEHYTVDALTEATLAAIERLLRAQPAHATMAL